tara:strand:+ start:1739 stop:2194 length:456 start_codon:yes stop_codon:yes gene_type:complete
MKGFYNVLEKIKDQLLSDKDVHSVTTGDITRIDLSKQTAFPLSHIVVNNATNSSTILTFDLSVIAMDIVNQSKEETVDIFRGNNNEQDILNTQLVVLNKLTEVLKRGDLYTDLYQVVDSVSFEPFYDRFENEVAGWVASFSIQVPNDVDIC